MKKKVLFWVEIPCVDGVGSCTYDDACAMLSKIKCPPDFKKYGIPCQCPIKAVSVLCISKSFSCDDLFFNSSFLKLLRTYISIQASSNYYIYFLFTKFQSTILTCKLLYILYIHNIENLEHANKTIINQSPFQGNYSLPTSTIEIPKIPDVPSFLTDGDYQITAKLVSQKGELGCLFMELSLTKDQ